jgi:hypothetical protein
VPAGTVPRRLAAQRVELAGRQPVGVEVLPHEAVEAAPGLHALRQVLGVERHDDRRDLVLVGEQVDAPDDVAGALGDHADGELGAVVDREADLGLRDGLVAVDERDLELAPEGRRLGIQQEGLVGVGRQVDHLAEARPALRAAGHAQLTGEGRALVRHVDRDGHPRADARMPVQ